MKPRPLRALMIAALVVLTGCTTLSPTALPSVTLAPPTATSPPTETPVDKATPTDTPIPPTETSTATPVPPTETPEPTATPTPLPPLSGDGGGVLAFVSDRSGSTGVYVMNADGSDQRPLTDEYAWSPAWSPDGKQIALTCSPDDDYEICVANADGTDLRRLTDNVDFDWRPAWSPESAQITFASNRDGNDEIYMMNADGRGQRRLTNNDTQEVDPAWSSDGTQIAFVSDRNGNDEIYTMDVNGRNLRRLTDNDAVDWWPAWSPDGTRIAFMSGRDDNHEIYVMNADGTDQRRLTDNDANDGEPAWSPDGARIAFQSNRDGDWDIYVMNSDGTDQQKLTDNDANDSSPTWQPAATTNPRSQSVCTQTGQIVQNGDFTLGTNGWEKPYGRLVHTTSEYTTGPGAAKVITSDPSGSLDYHGTFGQCIDLSDILDDWPELDGRKYMTLEAYLKTDANISSANLNGIFLESTRCSQEQVGYLYPPSVSGDQDWMRVSETAAIPEAANSLHIFVWATGRNDSATVYVDDIRACAPSPDVIE